MNSSWEKCSTGLAIANAPHEPRPTKTLQSSRNNINMQNSHGYFQGVLILKPKKAQNTHPQNPSQPDCTTATRSKPRLPAIPAPTAPTRAHHRIRRPTPSIEKHFPIPVSAKKIPCSITDVSNISPDSSVLMMRRRACDEACEKKIPFLRDSNGAATFPTLTRGGKGWNTRM